MMSIRLVTAGRLQAHSQRSFPLSRSLLSSADLSTDRTFLKNAAAALFISQETSLCSSPPLLHDTTCLAAQINTAFILLERKSSDSTAVRWWAWLYLHFQREILMWTVFFWRDCSDESMRWVDAHSPEFSKRTVTLLFWVRWHLCYFEIICLKDFFVCLFL